MDPRAKELIEFVTHKLVKQPGLQITDHTPLVSSALIDSFSLVDLLLKLEQVTGKRIGASRVSPADFETVQRMLQVADAA